VHRGPGVALGDDHPLPGHHVGGGQPGRDDGDARLGVAAQHAEPGAGHRRRPPAGHQVDRTGAEEDEVPLRQPAQQLGGLVRVRGGVHAGVGGRRTGERVEGVGQGPRPRGEPVGVLVHGADVGEHRAQAGDQVGGGLRVDRAVQDDGHPGLGEGVGAAAGGVRAVAEGQQPAGDVAPDDDDRVDDVVQAHALADHLGGDRVDEEGHVVGDHPQHRVAVVAAVDVDRGRALRAGGGQAEVVQGQGGERLGVAAEHLGGRLTPVEAVQQGAQVGRAEARGQLRAAGQLASGGLGGPVQQLPLLLLRGLQRGQVDRALGEPVVQRVRVGTGRRDGAGHAPSR
jgi:hypothetical protein